MYRKLQIIAVLPFIAFFSGCDKEIPESRAVVWFTKPVPTVEALRLASDQRLKVVYLNQPLSVGDDTLTIFHSVNVNASVASIQKDWQEQYEGFLQDLATTADTLNDEESRNYLERLKSAREQAKNLMVNGMTVIGSQSAINALKGKSDIVESIMIRDNDQPLEMEDSEALNANKNRQVLNAAIDPNTWVPNGGGVNIAPGAYGGRFVYHTMLWFNVTGFSSGSTYEHDFFLNNSPSSSLGPGTYLNRNQDYSGIPLVTYAVSNLPQPYLDTRFQDPSYIVAYTIGSAYARGILTNSQYYTYILTPNGDANRDNAALVAQLGYRNPSWCYSTWCSFGLQNFNLFNFWSISVPSGFSWRR